MSKPFIRAVSVAMLVVFGVGCASTTIIRSEPSGADVYIDGERVGKTPYTYSDTKTWGSSTGVRVELAGRAPQELTISRSELDMGVFIPGLLCLWPLLLWAGKYKPSYTAELQPRRSDSKLHLLDPVALSAFGPATTL